MRFLGTAIGTYGSGIQSHSDFISKTKDKANTVVFKQVNLKFETALSQLISISLFLEGEGGWELAKQ